MKSPKRCNTNKPPRAQALKLAILAQSARWPWVYSLSCIDGLRTQEALDAFKVAVEEQGNDEAWPKEIRIAVGELDGTVAWETPIKAWEYVLGQADGEITPEFLDQSYVVEFEGVNLGKPIPERLGGGRQVKVTDPGRIILARQFAKENGYEIPFEREPKPFEDSAEYEDE